MTSSYIKAVQIIADDQTQVATKIQELIDTEGIDSGEINNLSINNFGANKFLIAILYDMFRDVFKQSTKFGLTAVMNRGKLVLARGLTVTAGLKISVARKLVSRLTFTTKFGLTPLLFYGKGIKLSTKFGLKAISTTSKLSFNPKFSTTTGLKATRTAQLNGVPIIIS